jgi:hypothetical protein
LKEKLLKIIKEKFTTGNLVIFFIFYSLASYLIAITPIFLNVIAYESSNDFILYMQRKYYKSMRSIFQGDASCEEPNKYLGYRPKNGSCKFSNFEFETTLNFNDGASVINTPINHSLPKIIVVGDSHAMGWGVSTNQTFSYKLGELGYELRNYSMASYATEQEIVSAIESDLFDRANYIIIQYCENDLKTNKERLSEYKDKIYKFYLDKQKKQITSLTIQDKIKGASKMFWDKLIFLKAFSYPFRIFLYKEKNYIRNAYDDQKNIIEIINNYPILKNKKIIVFYSNSFGKKFTEWNRKVDNILFLDLNLDKTDYFFIDDHLNEKGHQKIALKLEKLLY